MRVVDDMQSVLGRVERLDGGSADVERFDRLVRGTVGQRDIDALIGANAATYSIDPALVRSIVEAESGFNPRATSPAGARGLMQLMPETAQSLGVVDAYDPTDNLRGGTRYLRGLLDRFGDVRLAVAAYNAGPAAVERFGGVPPFSETQAYVRRVLTRYLELSEDRRGAVLKPAKLR
jgi:soluble lytic murein transglycosylase-like protein